jgi:hypothetical protein
MSKSVVTEIQSHITVMLPVKSALDLNAAEQALQSAVPQMIAAADAMGTVHFARFIRLSELLAWAVQRRRFAVSAMTAPIASGWSGCGVGLGDSASVQATTRVNAEQASKRTMCRPTRRPYRGSLKWLREMSEEYAQLLLLRISFVIFVLCSFLHSRCRGALS